MSTSALSPSLFEDWEQRRAYLLAENSSKVYAQAQLRVLNYMLQRYCGDVQAQRPARFSFSKAIVLNERRVAVFHHLGRTLHSSNNKVEAERQIISLVRRMRAADADLESDDAHIPFQLPHPTKMRRSVVYWRRVVHLMNRGKNVDGRIRWALQYSRYLPRAIVQHLCERVQNPALADIEAVHYLVYCRNPRIVEWTTRAWRARAGNNAPQDPLRRVLEHHFRAPDIRPIAAEKIRAELASDDPKIRLAAISLIAKIGDLDDVGLLMDLLSLPVVADEDPREREALERAMWELRNSAVAT